MCTTYWPSWMAPLALSMVTTLGSMSSGTVRRSRSQSRATAVGFREGTSGSSAAIRLRDASDSPAAATISWPASRSAAARTAPTRPAPITPTRSVEWAGSRVSMLEPFVPVPPTPSVEGRCGYRTNRLQHRGYAGGLPGGTGRRCDLCNAQASCPVAFPTDVIAAARADPADAGHDPSRKVHRHELDAGTRRERQTPAQQEDDRCAGQLRDTFQPRPASPEVVAPEARASRSAVPADPAPRRQPARCPRHLSRPDHAPPVR